MSSPDCEKCGHQHDGPAGICVGCPCVSVRRIVILGKDESDCINYALRKPPAPGEHYTLAYEYGLAKCLMAEGKFDRVIVTPMFHSIEKVRAEAILQSVRAHVRRQETMSEDA